MARTTPVNSGYSIITGSATGSNKAYVDVWLEWKQLSTDTNANTSQVRVLLYAACTKSSSTSWTAAEKFGYVGYDGGNKQYRSTTYNFANNAVNCFGDYTFTIAHDSDGTKSITLQGEWSTSHSTYISGGSVSGKVTLETIPRASSITSAANVVLGNACSVVWTPNSASFLYRLAFSLGSWSHTTGNISPNKVSAYTYNGYTIPLDGVAQQITGSKTGTMSVVLHTYSADGSLIGSSPAKAFTVTVPENESTKPTVEMTLTAVDAFDGLCLLGRTKVQATITATGQYGASINSRSMTVDGKTYKSPWLSNALTTAGEVTVTGTAVDSRGIPGSVEQTVTVLPYYRPKVTATAYRCAADGTAADDGEFLKIRATVDYASVDGKNSASLLYRYRVEGAEKYTSDIPLAAAMTAGETVKTETLLDGTLYKENAWSVQIIARDTVGEETVVTVAIPSEAVFRHKRAGGKGLGLGGYCDEDELLDVHWNTKVRKDLSVEGKTSLTGGISGNLDVDGSVKADNYGGIFIKAVRLSASNTFTIQSKIETFASDSTQRQSLLLFGSDNGAPVCGTLSLSGSGTGTWGGTGGVSITGLENGKFSIALDVRAYDWFTLLSAEPFEVAAD